MKALTKQSKKENEKDKTFWNFRFTFLDRSYFWLKIYRFCTSVCGPKSTLVYLYLNILIKLLTNRLEYLCYT